MIRKLFMLALCSVAVPALVACGDSSGVPLDTGGIVIDSGTDTGGDTSTPPDTGTDSGGGACGTPGAMAGACRTGECNSPLTCEASNSTTIGTLFGGVESGTQDPDWEDNYIPTGMVSTVPVSFGPGGGQCSQGCDVPTTATGDDGCGSCSSCTDLLGGSPAFAGVGLSVYPFVSSPRDADGNIINDGICRLDCDYDPATNGGCPTGYTCEPRENICVEACTDDSQCTLAFGNSRSAGFVTYEDDSGATCNPTTGRCEATPPAEAGLNTECTSSYECPTGGICLLGYCATLACADASGTMAGPIACPDDGACLGFAGNGSICIASCNTADDCNPGQACQQVTMPFPNGDTGYCFGICDDETPCRDTERCIELRADDPDEPGDDSFSSCLSVCDIPGGGDITGAITCEAGETCVQEGTEDYGTCQALDSFCDADEDCHDGQACELLGADAVGRCIDGCTRNADCDGAEECRIQTDSTTGVCRAPGGECSGPPEVPADDPLRGDAQCIEGETCGSTDPEMVGACAA